MLTVFLTGRGTYFNSSLDLTVSGNMAGLVPPEDEGVLMADPDEPYDHFYCRFNGGYALTLARTIIERRGRRFFPVDNAGELADCLRPMCGVRLTGPVGRFTLHEANLARVLALLLAEPGQAQAPRLDNDTLQRYLEEHIEEPFELEAMASFFHLTRTSLCRAVRAISGASAQSLQETLKIERSCRLIRHGNLTVSEVALRVGYNDPYYFSRVFKKHTGFSPRHWRRQISGQATGLLRSDL